MYIYICNMYTYMYIYVYIYIYMYIYIYISHPCCIYFSSLLLLAYWPHSLLLQKAEGKVTISPHLTVLSAQDLGGKGFSLSLSVFTYQILWRTQMGHVPSLNQSPWPWIIWLSRYQSGVHPGAGKEWVSPSTYMTGWRESGCWIYKSNLLYSFGSLYTDMVLEVKNIKTLRMQLISSVVKFSLRSRIQMAI